MRAYESVSDARASIGRRTVVLQPATPHASLDGMTPDQVYFTPLPFARELNSGTCSTHRSGNPVQIIGATSECSAMVDRLRIIQDYGALMERNPSLPTRIEDVSVLPHPKAAILDALIFEIGQEHPKHIDDMLRFGAISLAQYQRDVGREPLEMLGTDARNLPRKLAEQKHLAEVLSKMQDRFKKFDELAQTDLRLINGKIATVDAQK